MTYQELKKIIKTWVLEDFGESEASDPSWNIENLTARIINEIKLQETTV